MYFLSRMLFNQGFIHCHTEHGYWISVSCMKICSTSQNDPGWLWEGFLTVQLFVQPLLVTVTERKNVGSQSELEADLCLNRIKLSEWLLLVWPPDTHFCLCFHLPLKINAFTADGKHTPQKNRYWKAHIPKIGAQKKGRKIGNRMCSFCLYCWRLRRCYWCSSSSHFLSSWSRRQVQLKLPCQDLHFSKPLSFTLGQVCSHLLFKSSQLSSLLPHTHSPPAIISLAATFRFFDPKCSFDPSQHKTN